MNENFHYFSHLPFSLLIKSMSIDPSFRLALAEYETKNYKKSLTLLEKLLKKKPTYGSAYALKALVISNSEPRYRNAPPSEDDVAKKGDLVKPNYAGFCPLTPETIKVCDELISKALKYGQNDPMTAHVCALYYRHAKDYEKAASAYAQAIANRNGNAGIFRDLASCMSQLRILNKLPDTRFQYLQSEPGYRANYSSTAVSYDLAGNPEAAVKVCGQIEDIIKDKLVDEDIYENSSLALYKGTLLAQYDQAGALKYIDELLASEDKFKCNDTIGMHKLRIEILFKLERYGDAESNARELIKINPDNLEFYQMLFRSLQIENDQTKKHEICIELAKNYPRSDMPKHLPLTFLDPKSPELEKCMDSYITTNLNKGVPAIFSCLKGLYKNEDIRKVIELIVLKLEKEVDSNVETPEGNPLTLTWVKYFLSQHYYQCGDYVNAMNKIEEGLRITPTLIELYMYKARILKHQGKLGEAANIMNFARGLDLQDRFVNTKTTKYYLRAGLVKDAIDTISVFTKNDEAKTGIRDLHVLQSCWFVSELADSFRRLFKEELQKYINRKDDDEEERQDVEVNQQLEEADDETPDPFRSKTTDHKYLHLSKIGALFSLTIQRYISMMYIFKEYEEDQFDFHHYAFRKGTIRAYKEMIQWADNLFTQPLMGKAFFGLMDVISYVKLFGNEDILKIIQTSIIELGYSPISKEGKLLSKKLTGKFKRSKKDKRDEIKWRENLLDYCKVDDTDPIGIQTAGKLFIDNQLDQLEWANSLVKTGRDLAQDANFIMGEWEFEAMNGKWVAGLASIRKMKAVGDSEKIQIMVDRTGEYANNADDKMSALIKMGLLRI